MTAAAIMFALETAGITVSRRGDQLVLVPASRVPAELVPAIKAAKPELLRMLAAAPVPAPDGLIGYTTPDLTNHDRRVLYWLDVTNGQTWRNERFPGRRC